ncbi:type II toxin-antitoxin system ParD family antitoxin [Methylobacterium organophilum]|uniref:ribbon-helix-helix domain-containing protein n=1 Tax=Methylobacterium organophilum TaxID=410 RepID=UPI001F1381A7|nr:type II toxin-antitoxin system ParD family antitoxin [Methylobacterium organophilum]UMY18877.1 type II toxin-antitoxin system ParD family antitoxin [Methylobacterium organophilum]
MRPADTINVTLAPEMLQAVRESVEASEYASTSEAVSDALPLWQHRRREDGERLAALRARIRRSLDDPRPPLSLKEVEARIDGLHAETVKAHRDAS